MTTAVVGRPIVWRPLPGMQTRFLARQEFEVLAGGAAGPGKTDCLINDLRHFHQPWCHRLFVRRTMTELRECISRAYQVIPLVFPGAVWRHADKLWTFPSGARWTFSYCESYKDATRHQGSEYTELFVDELTQIHDEAIYLFLRSRVRSSDPEGQKHLRVRATSNPGGPGHAWVKARWIDTCGKEGGAFQDSEGRWRAFVPGLLDENPYLSDDYRLNLLELPQVLRQQLLEGNWEAGLHTAFSELVDEVMLVPPFDPPDHWAVWGGHDWGFRHYAVTVELAEDEYGQIYVIDSVWGRLKQPDALAEQIWENLNVPRMRVMYCGTDVKYDIKSRGEHGPTIADTYSRSGIPVADAATSRRAGYSHMVDLLSWRGRGPGEQDIVPRLRFCDTPGNRRLLNQLRGLIVDPDDPRDVLKVDADYISGTGGDDGYDALRYGIYSRRAAVLAPSTEPQAWDQDVLRRDALKRRQPFLPSGDPLLKQRKYLDGAEELGL